MKIYLASPHSYPGMIAELIGGVSGNLNPAWKDISRGKGWDDALASFLGRNRESALDPSPDG